MQESSQAKTIDQSPTDAYEKLLNTYAWVKAVRFGVFPELSGFVYYTWELETALQSEHQFTAAQRTQLTKILHKMHSMIAFALRTGCFVWPEQHVRGQQFFYQQAFDLYKHKLLAVEKDEHRMMVRTDHPCYFILSKMRELNLNQLDPEQTNARFYQKMLASTDTELHKLYRADTSTTYTGHIQYFFKDALIPQIISNTNKAMGDTQKRFPFHRDSFEKICSRRKKEKFAAQSGLAADIEYARQMRNAIACPQHLATTIGDEQVFPDPATLVGHLNYIVTELNKHRTELHRLVRQHTEIVQKDGREVLVFYGGKVKPKPLLLPFFKIFQVTDRSDELVQKAYDGYHDIMLTATKTGALPLLLALNRKKIDNPGLHLDHLGSNFGFTRPDYYPLPLLKYGKEGEDKVMQAITEIKTELVDSWLAAQEKRFIADSIDEKIIYQWLLAHEIATAQVLLQDPTHSPAVSSLMRKFLSDPATPQWLRVAKTTVEALDIGLIVLIVLPFVPYSIPLALASTAVNFLWMGTATVSERIARARLRLAERALLSGNSQQVRCGMELLQKFYEKRRDAETAVGAGGAFTLTGLSMIAKGLDGKLKTTAVEIAAAFSSEIEIISGGRADDEQTDAQRLEDCFEPRP